MDEKGHLNAALASFRLVQMMSRQHMFLDPQHFER
jgi:hypothetical protein